MKSFYPKELKARLDAGEAIEIIDVRDEWELEVSKLDAAKHIPMDEILERLDEVPKDRPVVFLCRSGSRSGRVADYLTSQGYTNTYNLEGGILQWASDIDPSLPRFYH